MKTIVTLEVTPIRHLQGAYFTGKGAAQSAQAFLDSLPSQARAWPTRKEPLLVFQGCDGPAYRVNFLGAVPIE